MARTPDNARIAEAAGLFITAVMADAAEMPPYGQEFILACLVAGARGSSFESDDPVQVLARLAERLTAIISRKETPVPRTWLQRQKIKLYLRSLAFFALLAPRTRMARAADHLIRVWREELDL